MKRFLLILLAVTLLFTGSSFSLAATSSPAPWAKENIDQLKRLNDFKKSIFSDYSANISRGDFIYLAVKTYEMLNYNKIEIDTSIHFSDTDDLYVLKAASLGITQGVGNGKFGYNDNLTREQLAVLMTKTINLIGSELEAVDNYKFTDENDFSNWALESIYIAKKNGIIKGVGNDKFDAHGYASKEQALTIIYNTLREHGHGQFTFTDVTGYKSSTYSTLPNIESIKSKYLNDLSFNFGQDSLSINFNDTSNNITSFTENYWSGSMVITNRITQDTTANQARDEIYSELLGKDEYSFIYDSMNIANKIANTTYTTPSGKYDFSYSEVLRAPVLGYQYQVITITPTAVGFKEIKYSPEDPEYWNDFPNNEDVINILASVPEGTETYSSNTLIVGSSTNLNQGDLRISTHANFDDIKFQITGWSQPGVQSSLKQFLNLWTLDGDEIFNTLDLALDGKANDSVEKWLVGTNGTEYFLTDEGNGVTIIVKK